MHIGIWEILIVGLILLLLFGKGKVSELMGDLGKGITSFKKGISGEKPAEPAPPVATPPTAAISPPTTPPKP